MPPIKQYLRVKRLSLRDAFLLSRVDVKDGRPFRPGDVVAACRDCRQVSKRAHWQAADNACPFCGGRESLAFSGKRDLQSAAQPPVYYAARGLDVRPLRRVPVKTVVFAVLAALLVFLIWPRGNKSKAGFVQTDDSRFYYQDSRGQRFQNGDYIIDGKMYHFQDGFLSGAYALKIGNLTKLTDETGALRQGWAVHEGKLVYLDEYGVASSRVPGVASAGFYELEGLGLVFLTSNETPGQGWLVFHDELYHLADGKAAPVPSLPGTFDARGRYLPAAAGFVDTESGAYYLDQTGRALSGFVAHQGFVYLLDDTTYRRVLPWENELPGVSVGFAGALIPESDRIFPCQGGGVIAQARTGAIRTGWTVLEGSVYCAGADGYLRCGEDCASPAGAFDASGRFLPAQAGRLEAEGLVCFVRSDGSLATGCVKEGDALCLYDEQGLLRANAQIPAVGVTDASGALHPYAAGMYQLDGAYYCLSQQGKALTGWQRVGKLYYFDPVTGRRASAGALVDGVAYPLSGDGAFTPAVEGLYRLGQDSYYVLTDGNLASGWRAVEDQLRYFDEQTGKLREDAVDSTQTGWLQKNATRFYILENGQVARGWQIIDQRVYYFNPQTGAALTGAQQIDGRVYRFREDGALQPDHPLALSIGGVSLRIGAGGSPQGGFLYENGHLFYYDPDTAALSVQLPKEVQGWTSAMGGFLIPQSEGILRAQGASYYLDSGGNVITGWFVRGDLLFWADPATGQLAGNGQSAQWNGAFQDGVFTPASDGVFQADGREYLFQNGKLTSGWVMLENGVGYVSAGRGYARGTTLVLGSGRAYQFSENGRYVPGQNRLMRVQGQIIYLLADGSLPAWAGIYPLSDQQADAWTEESEGAVPLPRVYSAQHPAPYETGGFLAVVQKGGQVAESARDAGLNPSIYHVQSGVVVPLSAGLQDIGGNTYLLLEDGSFAVGVCLYQQRLYRFDPDTGVMTRNALGFGENGVFSLGTSGLRTVNGRAYWIADSYGIVGVGWLEDQEGRRLYAGEDGVLVTGFVSIDGSRYYFSDSSGGYAMARNQFISNNDAGGVRNEYYAGDDGRLVTGWQVVFGVLRYFDEEGRMLYDTVQDGRYINIYGEVI